MPPAVGGWSRVAAAAQLLTAASQPLSWSLWGRGESPLVTPQPWGLACLAVAGAGGVLGGSETLKQLKHPSTEHCLLLDAPFPWVSPCDPEMHGTLFPQLLVLLLQLRIVEEFGCAGLVLQSPMRTLVAKQPGRGCAVCFPMLERQTDPLIWKG